MVGMTARDFSRLPEPVRLDETVTISDERPVQAPEGDRNQALWEAQEAGG
jgi:hypothetical protein